QDLPCEIAQQKHPGISQGEQVFGAAKGIIHHKIYADHERTFSGRFSVLFASGGCGWASS
ncbi:MAG: hypothetical protein KDD10_29965, partial [Phaeodactylibacter sp.]|nr:hypothetical protein [Phaeodactylibacter sp.]